MFLLNICNSSIFLFLFILICQPWCTNEKRILEETSTILSNEQQTEDETKTVILGGDSSEEENQQKWQFEEENEQIREYNNNPIKVSLMNF